MSDYMKVTKEYMEQYAKLSLVYCYDERLSVLQKGEEPDWQSIELDVGIEVTEALHREDGRKRNAINQYFGKGLDCHQLKEQFGKKYPEYDGQLWVLENTACFSDSYDMQDKIQQVCLAIESKTRKLNHHYRRFRNNWLYVFLPGLLNGADIPEIFQAYEMVNSQFPLKFDKVFLNSHELIYIMQPDDWIGTINISDDILRQIKNEAQQNS